MIVVNFVKSIHSQTFWVHLPFLVNLFRFWHFGVCANKVEMLHQICYVMSCTPMDLHLRHQTNRHFLFLHPCHQTDLHFLQHHLCHQTNHLAINFKRQKVLFIRQHTIIRIHHRQQQLLWTVAVACYWIFTLEGDSIPLLAIPFPLFLALLAVLYVCKFLFPDVVIPARTEWNREIVKSWTTTLRHFVDTNSQSVAGRTIGYGKENLRGNGYFGRNQGVTARYSFVDDQKPKKRSQQTVREFVCKSGVDHGHHIFSIVWLHALPACCKACPLCISSNDRFQSEHVVAFM